MTERSAAPPTRTSGPEWLAIAVIMVISGMLLLLRLDQQGWGNPYYTATVRSMLSDPRLWFFGSFDPAGWVTVDKPPMGFWVQSLSVALLGYSGIAVILPQALATIASVIVLWQVVRDRFGPVAGVTSALVFTLTPITVATGRTNTIDPQLVLLLLLSAWALQKAIDRSSLGWLVLSGVLIGFGFLTKMLEAYLVVPAWGASWLLATSAANWRRRVGMAVPAGVALVLVSFSWLVIVDLIPANQRPYIGSSSANSAVELAFGYNGAQRLLGDIAPNSGTPSPGRILQAFGAIETGAPGPHRLFNSYLATQASWLLVFAIVGGIMAWLASKQDRLLPLGPKRSALVFWGMWLATAVGFFSVAAQFHRYYLVMLAPPIAALVGAGAVALWEDYRRPNRRGLLLPILVFGSTAIAWYFVWRSPEMSATVGDAVAATGVLGGIFLLLGRNTISNQGQRLRGFGAVLSIVGLLLGPAVWSVWSVTHPVSSVLPAAGPGTSLVPDFGPPGDADSDAATPSISLDGYAAPDPKLLAFLDRNRGDARFTLATLNATSASPFVIAAGMPVAALGGFVGQDPIITPRGLQEMVATGEVRFVMVPDPRRVSLLVTATDVLGRLRGDDGEDSKTHPGVFLELFESPIATWVTRRCQPVPESEWTSPSSSLVIGLGALDSLYDCRPDLPRS